MGVFEREEEELRQYDADAFFYFAGTLLLVLLFLYSRYVFGRIFFPKVPLQFDFDAPRFVFAGTKKVRKCATKAMEEKRLEQIQAAKSWRGAGLCQNLFLHLFLWTLLLALFGATCLRIKNTPHEIGHFDPYEILGVTQSATEQQIKKAFRQKSLQHHPDKNPDNPLAVVTFHQVKNAYAALTSDERYGNARGDAGSDPKVGIALHPAIMASKDRQIAFLMFFFSLMIGIPMSLVFFCLREQKTTASGISMGTLNTFQALVDKDFRPEEGPSLLVTADEMTIPSRKKRLNPSTTPDEDFSKMFKAMSMERPAPLVPGTLCIVRPNCSEESFIGRRALIKRRDDQGNCDVEVWPADGPPQKKEDVSCARMPLSLLQAAMPRTVFKYSDANIRRGATLVWAQLWRLHKEMNPDLRDELDQMLIHSAQVCRTMVDTMLGVNGCTKDSIGAVLHFQRCLIQAIDIYDPSILQIPHVTISAMRQEDGDKPWPTVSQVVRGINGADKALCDRLKLTDEQRLDVQAFCRHAPKMKMSAKMYVKDEDTIGERDLATLTVYLEREGFEEHEAAGPVHAPFFPVPKYEEWWILIYDNRARLYIASEHVKTTMKHVETDISYQIPRSGEFDWTIHAVCDSYVGFDVEYNLKFTALAHSKVQSEYFVHPRDRNITTFLEELMLAAMPPEPESSDEEDEPPRPAPPKKDVTPRKPEMSAAGDDSDSDLDEEIVPDLESRFWRVVGSGGAPTYRGGVPDLEDPDEAEEMRVGNFPQGAYLRGLIGNGRPEGWAEVKRNGGETAWVDVSGANVEEKGGLYDQTFDNIIHTPCPISILRKWGKHSKVEVTLEDVISCRGIDNYSVRSMLEEMLRKKLGNDVYEEHLNRIDILDQVTERRLRKARGYFSTENGCLWHVSNDGRVRGLNPDGSRMRDRVTLSEDKRSIKFSVFTLDETMTCPCIHWQRQDAAGKTSTWTWSEDTTLETALRIGTTFA